MTTIQIPEITISKTTLNGYLTVGLIVCTALTQAQGVPLWLSGGAATTLAVLRIVVGHLQADAATAKVGQAGELEAKS